MPVFRVVKRSDAEQFIRAKDDGLRIAGVFDTGKRHVEYDGYVRSVHVEAAADGVSWVVSILDADEDLE